MLSLTRLVFEKPKLYMKTGVASSQLGIAPNDAHHTSQVTSQETWRLYLLYVITHDKSLLRLGARSHRGIQPKRLQDRWSTLLCAEAQHISENDDLRCFKRSRHMFRLGISVSHPKAIVKPEALPY